MTNQLGKAINRVWRDFSRATLERKVGESLSSCSKYASSFNSTLEAWSFNLSLGAQKTTEINPPPNSPTDPHHVAVAAAALVSELREQRWIIERCDHLNQGIFD